MSGRRPQVLLVCNANRCRSVLAEWRLRVMLREQGADDAIALASAGLIAEPGTSMLPECAEMITATGGPAGGRHVRDFRSRVLTDQLLHDADIVVTMTMRELSGVLRVRPQALRYTVTLRELARAVENEPVLDAPEAGDRLIELLAWTVWHRARLTPADARANDIPDPIGGPPSAFVVTADRIADAVDRVTACLTSPRVEPARWLS